MTYPCGHESIGHNDGPCCAVCGIGGQLAALRTATGRFLDVQQKWHGAKSADEVAYWDKIGPEAYDDLKRALADTSAAASAFVQRIEARARESERERLYALLKLNEDTIAEYAHGKWAAVGLCAFLIDRARAGGADA